MKIHKYALTLFSSVSLYSLGLLPGQAAPIPYSAELAKYLVVATGIGTGSGGNAFESFNMSNVEIGADQEVLSTSSVGNAPQRVGGAAGYNGGLNTFGVFAGTPGANASAGGNRWNDTDLNHPNDTVGVSDRLPGARPIFEGIDFSGNVAITGSFAKFNASNTDTNADTGIQCKGTVSSCSPSPSSNNSYFDDSAPNTRLNLGAPPPATSGGISQFNPGVLLNDIASLRDNLVGQTTDKVFNAAYFNTFANASSVGFNNHNIKDGNGGPVITDLDAIDAAGNNDGIAVINIDVDGNKFELNNTDWILKSTKGTKAVFRMQDGTQFNFSNSSILLGDGQLNSTDIIDSMGAIFIMDAYKGTNELFNLNNVILGGIALMDLADFNPSRTVLLNVAPSAPPAIASQTVGNLTKINLQNAQGCAQFISQQVTMSNNRWTRCEMLASTDVPEPSSWLIFGFGLIGLEITRRGIAVKRRAAAGRPH